MPKKEEKGNHYNSEGNFKVEDRAVIQEVEYRLVPVDRMESEDNDVSVTFSEIVKDIWAQRKLVLSVIAACFVLGIFFAFILPEHYESKSTLIVESESAVSSGSLLSQYGGLLGLNTTNLGSGSAFPADFYPKIVASLPFKLSLIEKPLRFANYDTVATLYDFFNSIYEPHFYHYLKKNTVGVSGWERQLFVSDSDSLSLAVWDEDSLLDLPAAQAAIAKTIDDFIQITVLTEENNTVNIRCHLPDPLAAAELVKLVRDQLSGYISEYKTEKAQQNLSFIEKQLKKARANYQLAQDRLAEFRDENRNLVTAKAQTQLERLESEFNLAFNVYNDLARRYEEAKIQLQEDTPLFKTLEPVEITSSPSIPNRELVIFIGIFSGVFLGIGIALVRIIYNKIIKRSFLFEA